ncbi:unnamed protein product [Lactuca saligna]|uniref:non-specific serine/threonine protein kinase n=1 Tax=Lactuca saligna TaxID=75948 RepID=A0AA35Y0T5_LACSI|nr:unnamed protein product [Lactuca saligna]
MESINHSIPSPIPSYKTPLFPGESGVDQLVEIIKNNYLSGFIPTEIGNLSNLQTLDVSSNSLSGSIPTSLGNMRSLLNLKHINQLCKDDDGGSTGSEPTEELWEALLLVALMCFWGCFPYKKLGKNDAKGLAVDVGGGASIVMFHGDLPYSSKDIIKKLETLNEEHKLKINITNTFFFNFHFLEKMVSDFGIAKLLEDEEYHITTIVAGTFGYLAPEYMQSGRATEKTVYRERP